MVILLGHSDFFKKRILTHENECVAVRKFEVTVLHIQNQKKLKEVKTTGFRNPVLGNLKPVLVMTTALLPHNCLQGACEGSNKSYFTRCGISNWFKM